MKAYKYFIWCDEVRSGIVTIEGNVHRVMIDGSLHYVGPVYDIYGEAYRVELSSLTYKLQTAQATVAALSERLDNWRKLDAGS